MPLQNPTSLIISMSYRTRSSSRFASRNRCCSLKRLHCATMSSWMSLTACCNRAGVVTKMLAGYIEAPFTALPMVCVSRSNTRIDSTSFPKKTMR